MTPPPGPLGLWQTPPVPVAAAATPVQEARKPLDLNSLRLRWWPSAAGVKLDHDSVFAPALADRPRFSPAGSPSLCPGPERAAHPARADWQGRGKVGGPHSRCAHAEREGREIELQRARNVVARAEIAEPKREAAKPTVSGWMIQLGATEEEGKAKVLITMPKGRSGRGACPRLGLHRKGVPGGSTLYRARFSGFDEAEDAQGACKR